MVIYQPKSGYNYNSDSIFLYKFIRDFSPKGELLDIGSGVGVLALLSARDFSVNVTVVEKQKIMLNFLKRNFAINNLKVDIVEGDFLEVNLSKKFDFIISNPPFYDSFVTQSRDSIINIARYNHHLPLDRFIKRAKALLKPRGWFIFCYDAKQSDRVFYHLRENKLVPEKVRYIHPKVEREAKTILVASRLNSKSLCKVLPPLVVFDSSSNYLSEAKEAFLLANTHSIKAEFEGEEYD